MQHLQHQPRSGASAVPRRRCEGTAMGAITLDLRPGLGIGPFTLDENSVEEVPTMDARLAESIVHKWMNVKSRALGSDHSIEELPEILDGRMLKIWTD